ncbi:SufD family Fe-S cluster assembly protein [bacterium]|nr:MAG: SufD family Fe-S cluster assembly protein [bacterium]QQR62013.1 MAG: SufD family Fe-S cluster assembly protein [bacterium]
MNMRCEESENGTRLLFDVTVEAPLPISYKTAELCIRVKKDVSVFVFDEQQQYLNQKTVIQVEQGATLLYFFSRNMSKNVAKTDEFHISLAQGAQFGFYHIINANGGHYTCHTIIKQSGNGSSCAVFKQINASADSILSYNLNQTHEYADTESKAVVFAVLDAQSKLSVDGGVVILPDAERADAAFHIKGVVESACSANMTVRPVMEIAPFRVKAVHSVDISPLQTYSIDYLQSRGLELQLIKPLLLAIVLKNAQKCLPVWVAPLFCDR